MSLRIRTEQIGLEESVNAVVNRINRRGLNVKIRASDFTQPLGRITQKADEFTKSLEASNARVIAFGASAAIIGGVTTAFKELVVQAVNVQRILTDINVVLGTSQKNLAQFGKDLFDVARNTSQALDVAAEAALEFSRQGLTMEETLRRTNDALILTRLTGIDAAASVSGLTAAVNGFADAGLTTTSIINKLAAVDVKFAVSADDLIDALSRAGAVAQDAGVNFDQLVGAVTAAQQITARGGAVIGNSFKTIFTRIQRSSTLNNLEKLGVAVRDIEGNTLPAMRVLENLANTYKDLGDATSAAIAEQVGGVFQINVLKAALKDLNKENSLYAQATDISNRATDQAQQKNEMLQKTISSLAKQTALSVQELSANIGELALSPGITKILDAVNSFAEGLNNLLGDGEGAGSTFAKGVVKGIGSVITGPGVVLAFGVFAKLFSNAFKFAKSSLKDVLGIVTAKDKERAIQESIVLAMGQNKQLALELNKYAGDKNKQEEIMLNLIKEQTKYLLQQEKIAASLSPRLAKAGVKSDLTLPKGKMSQNQAGGYIPNYSVAAPTPIEQEKEKSMAIKSGYSPGKVKKMKVDGMGEVVYNDAETVKRFQGMRQPAIMPPEKSKAGQKYADKFNKKHGFDPYSDKGGSKNNAHYPDGLVPEDSILNKTKKENDDELGSKNSKSYSKGLIPNFAAAQKSGSILKLPKAKMFVQTSATEGRGMKIKSIRGWKTLTANISDILKRGGAQLYPALEELKTLGVNQIQRSFYFSNQDKIGKDSAAARVNSILTPRGNAKKYNDLIGNVYEQNLDANLKGKNFIRTHTGTVKYKGKSRKRMKPAGEFGVDKKGKGDVSASFDFIRKGRNPLEAKANSFSDANLIAKSLYQYTDKSLEDFLDLNEKFTAKQTYSDVKLDRQKNTLSRMGIDPTEESVRAYRMSGGLIPNFIDPRSRAQKIRDVLRDPANKNIRFKMPTKKHFKSKNMWDQEMLREFQSNPKQKYLGGTLKDYLIKKGYNRKDLESLAKNPEGYNIYGEGLIPNFSRYGKRNSIHAKRSFVYRPQGGKDWYTKLSGKSSDMEKFLKWVKSKNKLPPKQLEKLEKDFFGQKESYKKSYWDDYKNVKKGNTSASTRRNMYGTGITSARSLPGEESSSINITNAENKLFIKKDKMNNLIEEWMGTTPMFSSGHVPNFAKKGIKVEKILEVKDGDSVVGSVQTRDPVPVDHRLSDVDAIESWEPLGDEATKIAQKYYSGIAGAKNLEKNIVQGGSGSYSRGLFRDGTLAQELVATGLGIPDLRYTGMSTYKSSMQSAKSRKRGIWAKGQENHPKRLAIEAQLGTLTGKNQNRRMGDTPDQTLYAYGDKQLSKKELAYYQEYGPEAFETKYGRGSKGKVKALKGSLYVGRSKKSDFKSSGFVPNYISLGRIFSKGKSAFIRKWDKSTDKIKYLMSQGLPRQLATQLSKLKPDQIYKRLQKQSDSLETANQSQLGIDRIIQDVTEGRKSPFATDDPQVLAIAEKVKSNMDQKYPLHSAGGFIPNFKLGNLIDKYKKKKKGDGLGKDDFNATSTAISSFNTSNALFARTALSGSKGIKLTKRNYEKVRQFLNSKEFRQLPATIQNKVKNSLKKQSFGIKMPDVTRPWLQHYDASFPGKIAAARGLVPSFAQEEMEKMKEEAGSKNNPYYSRGMDPKQLDGDKSQFAQQGSKNNPYYAKGLDPESLDGDKSQFAQQGSKNNPYYGKGLDPKALDGDKSEFAREGSKNNPYYWLGLVPNFNKNAEKANPDNEKSKGKEASGDESGSKNQKDSSELNWLGFTPNFSSALSDAIKREKEAGVPASLIRVESDDSLKSSMNPKGLAVTNKIDEPAGVKQGIDRAKKMGVDPKLHGSAIGLVPNFSRSGWGIAGAKSGQAGPAANLNTSDANKKIKNLGDTSSNTASKVSGQGSATEDLTGKYFMLTSVAYGLQGAFSDVEGTAGSVVRGFTGVAEAATQAMLFKEGLSQVGKSMKSWGDTPRKGQKSVGGFGKAVSKVSGLLGPLGMAVGVAIPLFQYLSDDLKLFDDGLDALNDKLEEGKKAIESLSDSLANAEAAQDANAKLKELEVSGANQTIKGRLQELDIMRQKIKAENELHASLNALSKQTNITAEEMRLMGEGTDEALVLIRKKLLDAEQGQYEKNIAKSVIETASNDGGYFKGDQKAKEGFDTNIVRAVQAFAQSASRNKEGGSVKDQMQSMKSELEKRMSRVNALSGKSGRGRVMDASENLRKSALSSGADEMGGVMGDILGSFTDDQDLKHRSEVVAALIRELDLQTEETKKATPSIKEDTNSAIRMAKARADLAHQLELEHQGAAIRINLMGELNDLANQERTLQAEFLASLGNMTNAQKIAEKASADKAANLADHAKKVAAINSNYQKQSQDLVGKLFQQGVISDVALNKQNPNDEKDSWAGDAKTKTEGRRAEIVKNLESSFKENNVDANKTQMVQGDDGAMQEAASLNQQLKSAANPEELVMLLENYAKTIKDTNKVAAFFKSLEDAKITNNRISVKELDTLNQTKANELKAAEASKQIADQKVNLETESAHQQQGTLEYQKKVKSAILSNSQFATQVGSAMQSEIETKLAANENARSVLSAEQQFLQNRNNLNSVADQEYSDRMLAVAEQQKKTAIEAAILGNSEKLNAIVAAETSQGLRDAKVKNKRRSAEAQSSARYFSTIEGIASAVDEEKSSREAVLKETMESVAKQRAVNQGLDELTGTIQATLKSTLDLTIEQNEGKLKTLDAEISYLQSAEGQAQAAMAQYSTEQLILSESRKLLAQETALVQDKAKLRSLISEKIAQEEQQNENQEDRAIEEHAQKMSRGSYGKEALRERGESRRDMEKNLNKTYALQKQYNQEGNAVRSSEEAVQYAMQMKELNVEMGNGTLLMDTWKVKIAEANERIAKFSEDLASTSFDAVKDGFKGLLNDMADGTKSTSEMLSNFVGGIAKKMQDKLFDRAADQLTSGLFTLMGGEKFHSGGLVKKYASGGSTGQEVPAMLTNGEYVVRKKIVDRLGTSTLNKINQNGNLEDLYNEPNQDKFELFNNGGMVVPPIMRFAEGGHIAERLLVGKKSEGDTPSKNDRDSVLEGGQHFEQNKAPANPKNPDARQSGINLDKLISSKISQGDTNSKNDRASSNLDGITSALRFFTGGIINFFKGGRVNQSPESQHYNEGGLVYLRAGGRPTKAEVQQQRHNAYVNVASGAGTMLGTYLATDRNAGSGAKAPTAPKAPTSLNTASRLNIDPRSSRMSARFRKNDQYSQDYEKYLFEQEAFRVQQHNEKIGERLKLGQSLANIAGMAGGLALGNYMSDKIYPPQDAAAGSAGPDKSGGYDWTKDIVEVNGSSSSSPSSKGSYSPFVNASPSSSPSSKGSYSPFVNAPAGGMRGGFDPHAQTLADMDARAAQMPTNVLGDLPPAPSQNINNNNSKNQDFRYTQKKYHGGIISNNFNSGGKVHNFYQGGPTIRGMAEGGLTEKGQVIGPNGIDKVGPVMLDKGEYVIKASSVSNVEKQYPGFFDRLNTMKFNEGGPVSTDKSVSTVNNNESSETDNSSSNVTVNINVSGGNTSVEGGNAGQQDFGNKIKDAVVSIIAQEKRVGGMLRG